ncbi:response regulator transcription factor [Paenibacillus dauci]|uniref:response regulator transcription factor n=1 Tax=Paenibacillus dauci TaxID=1567106 RepID=UPI0006197C52|nr:response regulator transcription factor [Paenibacillus dauci]
MNQRLLLIEDDLAISDMVCSYLVREGYDIDTVYEGEHAAAAFMQKPYDLVLLDLMLPRLGGFEVLQQIRSTSLVPVLIMSAKNSDLDKALGLGFGADDYIAKPFSMIELTARVKAAIRRASYAPQQHPTAVSDSPDAGLPAASSLIHWANLIVDPDNYTVTKNNEPIQLTAKEFQILKLFVTHPNRVFTKSQLYASVWQDEYYGDENVINVHMRRLREKIEDEPSKPQYIKTLWGIGYKLGEPGL